MSILRVVGTLVGELINEITNRIWTLVVLEARHFALLQAFYTLCSTQHQA